MFIIIIILIAVSLGVFCCFCNSTSDKYSIVWRSNLFPRDLGVADSG